MGASAQLIILCISYRNAARPGTNAFVTGGRRGVALRTQLIDAARGELSCMGFFKRMHACFAHPYA